jgi:hypothetical protein
MVDAPCCRSARVFVKTSVAFAAKGVSANSGYEARQCRVGHFDSDATIRKHRITKCGLLPKNQHHIIK